MVSSTITLDKKSSSSSSSAAAAASGAQQASAEQNSNIITIPLTANASSNGTNCSDHPSSASSALNLSEQKISILFPKCKPRAAEHYQTNTSSGSVINNNHSNINNMSTITTNSKSDLTGTSSSLTTPTSLTSSSYTLNSKSYGMEANSFRGNNANNISGVGSGYDLLGGKSDLSSRMNNNHYDSSRTSRHTNSVDKYSFYYNNQPPPLSTSPTENNANTGSISQFLPSDDEEEEEELRKESYPRHSYYNSRQSHYYNLPKQDPGTPSNPRYHWDLSPSSVLSYSTPISSAITSASTGKRPSLKSSYAKVLQSPLEDESDIEDKLKYFNYQNEMHISSSSSAMKPATGEKTGMMSGIYSNYKTNEMIVFNDIDEERRRVQQQHQHQQQQESDHKHSSTTGAGLRVSAAEDPDEGITLHHHHHHQQQQLQPDNVGGRGSSNSIPAGKVDLDSSAQHKTTATALPSNSGSNIMGE